MSDKEPTASLNYEAEYDRAMRDLVKAQDENCWLRDELKGRERELQWHYGFREAVELIFRGKDNA